MHIRIEPSVKSSRAMSALVAADACRREAVCGFEACAALAALPWDFKSSFYAVGLYEGKAGGGGKAIAVSMLAKISFSHGQPLYGRKVLNLSYAVSKAHEGAGLASLVCALVFCSLARMSPGITEYLVNIQVVSTNERSLKLASKIFGAEGIQHPDVQALGGVCVQGGYTTFANVLAWGMSVIEVHKADDLLAALPLPEPEAAPELNVPVRDGLVRRQRVSVNC